MFRNDRMTAILTATLAVGLLATGCNTATETIALSDLTPEETMYITRFVVLERARAVSFADRDLGSALLDSLSTAWGDSAAFDALALLPDDPHRLAAVHELLERILMAEADSLLVNPSPGRLSAPLPVPALLVESETEPQAED